MDKITAPEDAAVNTALRQRHPVIYLDNHATTPVDPRVLAAMLPYFCEEYGNASSRSHIFGWQAEAAVEAARAEVALLLGASAAEIVFTSGATEANNLALWGVAEAYASKGQHIITQVTEHHAVLDCLRALEQRGCNVTYLPVDAWGQVQPEQVQAALTDKTILVSVMAANNEIGTLQPLRDIGALCQAKGVLLHTDAAQAAGRVPLDLTGWGVSLASVSAHKMYGPKGVGALFVRRKGPRVQLVPRFFGGGQERGWRPGTLNVPGIVGLGHACRLAREVLASEAERVALLRDRLQEGIVTQLDDVAVHGHPKQRLSGNLHMTFGGTLPGALVLALREVAVSGGAACGSADLEPSHVLRALKIAPERAMSAVRFGLGRFTTAVQVERTITAVVETVRRLRQLSS